MQISKEEKIKLVLARISGEEYTSAGGGGAGGGSSNSSIKTIVSPEKLARFLYEELLEKEVGVEPNDK